MNTKYIKVCSYKIRSCTTRRNLIVREWCKLPGINHKMFSFREFPTYIFSWKITAISRKIALIFSESLNLSIKLNPETRIASLKNTNDDSIIYLNSETVPKGFQGVSNPQFLVYSFQKVTPGYYQNIYRDLGISPRNFLRTSWDQKKS